MSHRKEIISAAAVVVVLALVFLIVHLRSSSASADARRQSVPTVRVSTPIRTLLVRTLQLSGDVSATQQAAIYSKVSGNIERIHADMGVHVQRGQALAQIDTTELGQQAQQAAATYENARLVHLRSDELFARNLVSRQDLDNAVASLKVARATFDAARTRLGYARIVAPFSGVVTRRYLDPGALVNPNNTILFTLMDMDEMKIIVHVLERDIPLITEEKEATVTVDAFPGRLFTGKVKRLSQAVDVATRTMPVEIDVPNRDHDLKPGMYAKVTLEVSRKEDALTLPLSSILKDNAGRYVLVVEQDTARRREVSVGIEQGDMLELVSGLTGSESVIITGQQFARPDSPVLLQH